MPDHVHVAVQMSRTLPVSDFVKKIKSTSSIWIKKHGEDKEKFAWQAGYGAFSLGVSQLNDLTKYIDKQEEHHSVKSFKEEYVSFLSKYQIAYDERYVWD